MQAFIDFLSAHQLRLLDIIGAVLGLVYILLEYKANIWFWIVSLIMPLVDMALYFKAGLFADFGMAVYYAVASVCGFIYWKTGSIFGNRKKKNVEISHFPVKTILPCVLVFLVLWLGLYLFLNYATSSTVPVRDSFTTALSIVALWALANKYIEQWLLWLVVDLVSCQLYIHKGIPFKAILYGIYVVIAVFGYRKWLLMYGR